MLVYLLCYNVHIQRMISPLTVNSEIFARILLLRIALEDIFATFKNSPLGHDLPMISACREEFIFTKLRIYARSFAK